ncbi:MAG: hypothetical protein QOG03_2373 [Actinomycetota bacterium]|nr:hypothetical protein [Actinomycetota bacterium]
MLRTLLVAYLAMVLMAAGIAFGGHVILGLAFLLAATGGVRSLAHDIVNPPLRVRVPDTVDDLL